ncbi:MAG: UDP-glucose 4-epimerase GalE [Alphaproteobacteria bacterium]|nr:MAG: UDP-glucose 4-epimerase GalE [Alphaproteobacteria bacterium]
MSVRKAVMVTGGAGYIGSHTAKALHHAGYRPVVFDDLSNGHAEAVKWGPLVVGDVRDRSAVGRCMAEHAIDAVIHFAGLIEVGRSMVEPDAFWDHNLNGVASVLAAMRATGVRRIVFSSTAAVYGQPEPGSLQALHEDLPLVPINPYGDSKLAAERLIAASARAYGLEGVALRYFNAAGADPGGELGEAHHPESHLIPLAIEAALGLGRPLTVFGQDFPTADGACVRDYIHVADLAQAHVLALDADLGPTRFAAMNLGLGRGRSVMEVIAAVDSATGRRTPRTLGPRREGDPASLVADPSRARDRLNWRPQHTELEGIVASAVRWRRRPAFGAFADMLEAAS